MRLAFALLLAATATTPIAALADPVVLVLKDHRFSPAEITVPAGERVAFDVRNQDGSVDEFDSSDLKVEEDLTPHGRVAFEVGPLKPGVYRFMGEAHPKTALGVVIVR